MAHVDDRELRPLRDLTGPAQITGEAVALDLPPAGVGMRILGVIIDLIVWAVTFFCLNWAALKLVGTASDAVRAGWSIVVLVTSFVLLPTVVETLTLGRSLGKLILGMRVVRTDGGAISFRHALVRSFVGFVEIIGTAGMVALVTATLTSRARRLGDLAAGTYVVRETRGLTLPPPAQMPRQLAAWADSPAVVSPLPQDLAARMALLVRQQHVMRTPAFNAVVTQTLREVLPHVQPPPPPGHDPFAVLVAISVLRRDADARRIERDARIRRSVLGR